MYYVKVSFMTHKKKNFISPDWGVLSKFWKQFWTPEISINHPLNFSFLSKSHFNILPYSAMKYIKVYFIAVTTSVQ